MSVEKVRAYLTPYGVAQRIRELEVSSATVELAAAALGVAPARIAKTLSFKVGERPILVVAAGDARINNSKYKHFFGVKARMLTPEEAVEHIGHAVGGVCPFACRRTCPCIWTSLCGGSRRCSPLRAAPPPPLS